MHNLYEFVTRFLMLSKNTVSYENYVLLKSKTLGAKCYRWNPTITTLKYRTRSHA